MLGAGLALTLGSPARAADDSVPLDTQLLGDFMETLGLKSGNEPQINYQERGPLVLPSNQDLPPPSSSNAAIASNPAWPKDPDIIRRQEEAKAERNRNLGEEIIRDQRVLSPSQLTPGRKPRPVAHRPVQEAYHGEYGDRLSPSEQGVTRGLFSNIFSGSKENDTAKFTGEPPRTALTDPPPGYQIPSPAQPYGIVKGHTAPTATNYGATHGVYEGQ